MMKCNKRGLCPAGKKQISPCTLSYKGQALDVVAQSPDEAKRANHMEKSMTRKEALDAVTQSPHMVCQCLTFSRCRSSIWWDRRYGHVSAPLLT